MLFVFQVGGAYVIKNIFLCIKKIHIHAILEVVPSRFAQVHNDGIA